MSYSARRGFSNGSMRPTGAQRQQEMQQKLQEMQEAMNRAQEDVEAKEFAATVGGGVVTATVNGKSFTVKVAEGTVAPAAAAAPAASGDAVPLPSPLPGTVVKIAVAEGDEVAEGDVILVIEAMKMETEIKAPKAGIVREISVTQSQVVAAGDTLAMIEEK